jgi:hypothetical protein
VKILKMSSMLFAILLFSGCTKTVYIDRPYEVKVPVKCKVRDVPCSFSGSDIDVVIGLQKCIVDLKKEAEVCR